MTHRVDICAHGLHPKYCGPCRFEHDWSDSADRIAQVLGYPAADVWLAAQFEFEYCAECGGDAGDHRVLPDHTTGVLLILCIGPELDA